jgi:general secretion pathway protein G
MRRDRRAGFTLVELLVVVAIIGIVAAIAIVNYLNSVERARQKRTMADIRSIAMAWEARATEQGGFTAAGFSFPTTVVTYADLVTTLKPTFMRNIPQVDGWGRPLQFGAGGERYAIRSSGRDGAYEGDKYDETIMTESFDCDIVFSNGNFVRYPTAMQTD